MMMGPFQGRRKSRQAHVRTRLAQVRRSRFKSLVQAPVRLRGGVTVLHHGVGREMHIRRSKRTEGRDPSHELDGLQLASKAKLQNISERELVGRAQRQRLQGGSVGIDSRSGQTPHGKRHFRLRSVGQGMAVGSAQHRIGRAIAVTHVTLKGHGPGGENRPLHVKARAHVGSAAKSTRCRTSDE